MELFKKLRELPRTVIVLLLVGLALRVVFIVAHQRPPISDERDYHQLAVNLLSAGTYGYNGVPTAYRPFAYPAFLSMVYVVAGEHPVAVKLFQAFFDILLALIVYFLLKNENDKTRWTAVALWCLYLPAFLYTNFLLSESIFTFLLVLLSFVLTRSNLGKPKEAFLAGILLGVLTLMKPGMLLLIVALPAMLYAAWIPLARYKFIVLGALLVLTPWLIRNYSALGKATLATNGGINLLIGNNPNTTGAYVINFPEEILVGAKTETEADETAYRYATNYILANPGRFIVNGVKKIAHLFSSESGLLVWSFHARPDDFSERFAAKYASLSLPLIALVNVSYILVLLLGALGLFCAPKNALWWFVVVLIGCWLVTHFVFLGGSRYHFPLMPFFALYAAPVVLSVSSAFQKLTKPQKGMFGVIVIGLISIWIAEAYTIINALSSH